MLEYYYKNIDLYINILVSLVMHLDTLYIFLNYYS